MLFLPMLTIAFPANSKFFFEIVLGLLNLKVLQPNYIFGLLGLDELKQKTSVSSDYGMQRNGNMLQNIGVFFIIIIFASLVGILIFLVAKLLWKYALVKKIITKIYDIVIFNAILRSFV